MADEALAEVAPVKLEEEELDLSLGDLSLKKKKKKKAAPAGEEAAAPAEGAAGVAAPLGAEDDLDMDLNLKKKKKKKKVVTEFEGDEGEEGGEDTAGAGAGKQHPWSGEDRDYTYEEMLGRVFETLRLKNPELTGERKRTILKPPQVAREGTKKTVFSNFMDMCKAMNRQQEHLSAYLLAELGTSGSLDGQQRLVIKGRFLPKSFETVLRRYVNEYVLCPGCKSVDTLLDRDSATRLMHLRCQQCGASRSVSAIKSGFVARVTKRKH